jgi:dihydroorotase
VYAVKYYPAWRHHQFGLGVTELSRCDAVFEAMQELGLPLLVHGEVTDPRSTSSIAKRSSSSATAAAWPSASRP